jgi:transcriptional regulator with XRE-family HTH domain
MILDVVKQDPRQTSADAMALFFDAKWFDARLAERGLSREAMAAVAGLSAADLALVFKDQRELSAAEVAVFAELLGAPAAEIAARAGVSTPVPGRADGNARILELERRVAALEAELARRRGP